jgi:acyl-CoA synthetase (AMP-forming)/AMP-acid ligase II
MKKFIILTLAMFALGASIMPLNAQASDEKIDHYEGKEFKNDKAAMMALIETSTAMAAIAADEELDVTKMEQIHETSYTTEDAVKFLTKKSDYDLTALAEKLEEVHLASEDHKAEELRRDFILYQAELTSYMATQ